MALNETWNIRTRTSSCHDTGRPFEDGETIFAAIFRNQGEDGYERRDYCEEAWNARAEAADAPAPYSFWRSNFEPPETADKKPEVVEKESAETLLRRLIEEDEASSENARYILALMLERKKLLKQVDAKEGEETRLLFYEHIKTGDAFIVRDPMLKLAEVDAIQEEVAGWLGGGNDGSGEGRPEPAAEAEPQSDTPSPAPVADAGAEVAGAGG